jgi:hypothetical protein
VDPGGRKTERPGALSVLPEPFRFKPRQRFAAFFPARPVSGFTTVSGFDFKVSFLVLSRLALSFRVFVRGLLAAAAAAESICRFTTSSGGGATVVHVTPFLSVIVRAADCSAAFSAAA